MIIIVLSFTYTLAVAITQWDWFPRKEDWGHIADIPPGLTNYTALLLPWTVMLIYLLTRRIYFRQPL